MPHVSMLVLVPILVAACACRATPEPPAASVPRASAEAPLTLVRGTHTAIRGERTVVLRSGDDWEELWREHTSAQIPTAEAPRVDFEKNMVVGVVLGACPSGGYSVEILRAERRRNVEGAGTGWRIVAHRTTPPPGSRQPAVLTKPFHFVVLPRSDEPVDFAWE